MDVTPLVKKGQQIIQSYKGGGFKISGKTYDGAVIVTPESACLWQTGAPDISGLTFSDFDVVPAEAEVLLLGCGARIEFLPAPLKNALRQRGLNVDVMDTGAACRTYNVLMAEGRLVAAAMLPFASF